MPKGCDLTLKSFDLSDVPAEELMDEIERRGMDAVSSAMIELDRRRKLAIMLCDLDPSKVWVCKTCGESFIQSQSTKYVFSELSRLWCYKCTSPDNVLDNPAKAPGVME